jgi:hemolysin activation/secretion protein
VQLGNLWGLDHQLTYQYTTTDPHHLYQAEAAEYRLPLPWRHYLSISAAQAVFEPQFEQGLFSLKGKNVIADMRYMAPASIGSWFLEFSAGPDFKQTNNNLAFGGFSVLKTAANVAQICERVQAVHRDPLGSWVFVLSGNESPGNINTKNTDAVFGASSVGARARYAYGTLFAQRLTELPWGFQSSTQAQGQLASADLLGSELFTLGGHATVRGYDENLFAGDEGYLVNQELRGPVWERRLPFAPRNWAPIRLRPLAFWDYGRAYYTHGYASQIALPPLMSAGAGLRSNLSSNFSLSADYGWQILRTTPPQPDHGRGHIQATIAF